MRKPLGETLLGFMPCSLQTEGHSIKSQRTALVNRFFSQKSWQLGKLYAIQAFQLRFTSVKPSSQLRLPFYSRRNQVIPPLLMNCGIKCAHQDPSPIPDANCDDFRDESNGFREPSSHFKRLQSKDSEANASREASNRGPIRDRVQQPLTNRKREMGIFFCLQKQGLLHTCLYNEYLILAFYRARGVCVC